MRTRYCDGNMLYFYTSALDRPTDGLGYLFHFGNSMFYYGILWYWLNAKALHPVLFTGSGKLQCLDSRRADIDTNTGLALFSK